MSKSVRSLIIIIVASVLVVSMITIAAVYSVGAALEHERYREMLERVTPLEDERRDLTLYLENMEKKLSEPIPGGATMTISLLDLNEEMYSLLYPMFLDAGDFREPDENTGKRVMTATLCLSPEELPGLEGNMTRDEFDEMISAGFSSAVFVNQSSAGNLFGYLYSFRKTLAQMSIDMPSVAYFSTDLYSPELHDATLLEFGIDAVIHEENDTENLIGQDLDSDIWRIGAVGWSGAQGSSLNAFNALLIANGGLSFGVAIHYASRQFATHFVPGDSEMSFRSMLGTFGSSVEAGELHVDGAIEGRENYRNYLELYALAMKDFEPERLKMLARIDEIDAALDAVYKEYEK
ncbi:MAG: hypothetical protein IKC87_03120 [Clostridia bacterium]|nr:hypothetical protein [Clostridia bacterium]